MYNKTLLQVLYVIKSTRRAAEMLIKHEAKPNALLASGRTPRAFYRVKQEQGNAFTILKNIQIETCSLVHYNFNSASLFIFVSYNYARAYSSWCLVNGKTC